MQTVSFVPQNAPIVIPYSSNQSASRDIRHCQGDTTPEATPVTSIVSPSLCHSGLEGSWYHAGFVLHSPQTGPLENVQQPDWSDKVQSTRRGNVIVDEDLLVTLSNNQTSFSYSLFTPPEIQEVIMHLFKLIVLLFAAMVAASQSVPRSSSNLELEEPVNSARDLSKPDSSDEDIKDSTESSLTPSIAKRSCYAGGVGWGSDKDRALELVDDACRDVFVSSYSGKTEKNKCYQLSAFKKVNFTVRRWHDSTRNLDFAFCKTNLRLEIKGCGAGGQSYRGNWRFRYVRLLHYESTC
jgi:hypothetical protein